MSVDRVQGRRLQARGGVTEYSGLAMTRVGAIVSVVAVLFVCAPAVASAAQSSQAAVRGVVRDGTGAVLPGTDVTLTSLETGQVRRTRSAADGTFQIVALPPGRYRLRCVHPGFEPAERDAELTIDLDLKLDLVLALAQQTQQPVEVAASDIPLVEASKTSLGRTIATGEIEGLPLPTNGARGVMVLAILTPGIVPVPNFTVFNISSAGQSAGSNAVLVDGMSMDGLGLSVGPPFDAIKEVRAVSNHFSAEFGQASGAVLNTVTRSGTNRAHARLTYLVQNGAWNATSAIARREGAEDPGLDQNTLGGFWSGPLARDRAFLFGTAEYTAYDTVHVNSSPVLAVFRPGESASIPVRVRIPKWFARSDMNLASGNVLTLTFNHQFIGNNNAAREDLSASERGRRLSNTSHDLTATDRQIIGSSAVLEVRGKWSRNRLEQNADGHCPGCATLNYPNALLLGKPAEAPTLTVTDRSVLAGVITWLLGGRTGSHTVKSGVEANVVRVFHDQPLNFTGTYMFRAPIPFDPAVGASYPQRFTQNSGNARTTLTETILSTFVQDDWRPRDGLFLNLGVRWDETFWPAPSRRMGDVAPRLGVAFDPWQRGTTVFRAAAGRYFDELAMVVARDNATQFLTRTITNPGYQGDMRAFDPAGRNPNGPASVRISTSGASTMSTPYTDQASVGLQQQIGSHLAVTADLVRALGHRLPVGRDLNHPDAVTGLRPDPSLFQKTATETAAHSWYTGLQIGLQKRATSHHSYSLAYAWSSAENDTDGNRAFPMDPDNILADRGRVPTNARHRVSAGAIVDLPRGFRLAGVVTARSGLPYNVTTGTDDNVDNLLSNDRAPGHARNDALGAPSFQADLRLSKTLTWASHRIELLAEAFNVTNHANWITYRGNTARPETFGTPGDSGPPRQFQLGVRIDFSR